MRAAPQSGGPSITIVSITDNTLTLRFDNFTPGETITLSYSPNPDCSASHPLPKATIPIPSTSFQTTYTVPGSGIPPGTYFLCATGTEGTVASTQTFTVNSNGTVQPTPSMPGTPGTTPTTTGTSRATTTASPGASATTGPGATGTPATGGQGATSPPSNSSSTLVAIILLCLLVLALLAYLIRIWLQGRQPSGPPSGGGGQQGP